MKIVKVVYTAKSEFVERNKDNIKNVMNDLQHINDPGIFYNVCLGPDGKTFTHTAFFKSEENHKVLNELSSFKYFQEELKSVGLDTPPKQELLTLVGSSTDIFR